METAKNKNNTYLRLGTKVGQSLETVNYTPALPPTAQLLKTNRAVALFHPIAARAEGDLAPLIVSAVCGGAGRPAASS